MQNYDYLADLTLDKKTGLYNLFITTYNGDTVTLSAFFCERKHSMRMDVVSNDIYGTNKYVGSLCQLNNILNPFSINDGMIIFYAPADELEGLMVIPESLKQSNIDDLLGKVKSDLINLYKKRKPDNNRINYKRDDDKLPPTILPENSPQIVFDNDKLKIAPNLFKVPTPAVVDVVDEEASNPVELERILVNRYIRQKGTN
jgi:hypothetical protein